MLRRSTRMKPSASILCRRSSFSRSSRSSACAACARERGVRVLLRLRALVFVRACVRACVRARSSFWSSLRSSAQASALSAHAGTPPMERQREKGGSHAIVGGAAAPASSNAFMNASTSARSCNATHDVAAAQHKMLQRRNTRCCRGATNDVAAAQHTTLQQRCNTRPTNTMAHSECKYARVCVSAYKRARAVAREVGAPA